MDSLAHQLAQKGYGAIPLPAELQCHVAAILGACGDHLRHDAFSTTLPARPERATVEQLEGMQSYGARRTLFYRKGGAYSSATISTEPAHSALRFIEAGYDAFGSFGRELCERSGFAFADEINAATVSSEGTTPPAGSSLAVQFYPPGTEVGEHVDACALTLVVLPSNDQQLQVNDRYARAMVSPQLPGSVSSDSSSDISSSGGAGSGLRLVAFTSFLFHEWLTSVPATVHRVTQVPAERTTIVYRLYPPGGLSLVNPSDPLSGHSRGRVMTVAMALQLFRSQLSSIHGAAQAPPLAGAPPAPSSMSRFAVPGPAADVIELLQEEDDVAM